MIVTLEVSIPRSANALPIAAGCAPAGIQMKMPSGFRSLGAGRMRKKSGLATGIRTEPTISPPAALKPRWKALSASISGPKSETIE